MGEGSQEGVAARGESTDRAARKYEMLIDVLDVRRHSGAIDVLDGDDMHAS